MKFCMVSLFPEMFDSVAQLGVVGRAIRSKHLDCQCINPRAYTNDVHHTVDDRSYGGGPGMVMKVQPLRDAIHAARKDMPEGSKVVYLSPQGQRFNQQAAKKMATLDGLILVSGRYEGIDERLIESEIDEEWSIGDYILSGGELGALVMMDAIARLVPGVLGDQASAEQDSFMQGLLDHPHYTRPEEIDGYKVPDVLLSGRHQAIREWRLKQSLGRTWLRRPDLLAALSLTEEQQALLAEFQHENAGKI